MIGTPGPFRVIQSDESGCVDAPVSPPRRRYLCSNYTTCLDVAAALNWDNFTCRGCCGDIDESLLWRARQAMKKDRVVSKLCHLPTAHAIEPDSEPPLLKIAKAGGK